MLAGRLHVATTTFALEEVPTPDAGPGQVRIQVRAAGVCLSDVHLIQGMLKPLHLQGDTVTLGHEVAGVIDQVGEGVAGLSAGQRVLLQAGEERGGAILTRGVDYDGGWAEYAVASADTVVPLPDGLPFEQACFIPDAVSTPWSAITSTARVAPGKPVGVWGVGGLGAHGVQLLRLVGAAPIVAVDPLPEARERALEFGADVALDPADGGFADKLTAATHGRGLAAAFDFAGVPAVREQAVRCLAPGGKLVLVGLADQPLHVTDGTRFSYLKQQILGHYGSVPSDVTDLVSLFDLGRVEFSKSVSRVMPLAEAAEAVRLLESKEGAPIRLVLQP
jgi:D-arabinose 1-dehydrogenase-like Zn-dependent alcohol dehydrogenase